MLKKLMSIAAMAAVILVATPSLAADYLGNSKSMKFHY